MCMFEVVLEVMFIVSGWPCDGAAPVCFGPALVLYVSIVCYHVAVVLFCH